MTTTDKWQKHREECALINTLNRGYDPYNHQGIDVMRVIAERERKAKTLGDLLRTPAAQRAILSIFSRWSGILIPALAQRQAD